MSEKASIIVSTTLAVGVALAATVTGVIAEENKIQPIESYDVLTGPSGMKGIQTPQEYFLDPKTGGKFLEGLGQAINAFDQGVETGSNALNNNSTITPLRDLDATVMEERVQKSLMNVANHCIKNWGSLKCHHALTASNNTLSGDVSGRLLVNGNFAESFKVINNCSAASTFNTLGATTNTLANAFVDCANAINNANKATGIIPDTTLMQVLVYSSQAYHGGKGIFSQLDSNLIKYKDIAPTETEAEPTKKVTDPTFVQTVHKSLAEPCDIKTGKDLNLCSTALINTTYGFSNAFIEYAKQQGNKETAPVRNSCEKSFKDIIGEKFKLPQTFASVAIMNVEECMKIISDVEKTLNINYMPEAKDALNFYQKTLRARSVDYQIHSY